MNFVTKPHNLVKPTRSSKQVAMRWPPHHLSFYGGINTYGALQDKLSFKSGPILVTKFEVMLEKMKIHEGPKILETIFFP